MLALSHRAPSLLPTTRAWCARPSAGKPEGAQPLGLDKERPNHTNKGLFAKLSDEQETTFHPEITSKARQQYRNSVLPRSAHTAACLRACLMLGAEAVFGVLSRLPVMHGCAHLHQDCPNVCTGTRHSTGSAGTRQARAIDVCRAHHMHAGFLRRDAVPVPSAIHRSA